MVQPLYWDIYLIINVRVFIKNSSTVEPPLSEKKYKGLMVAYESLSQPRMEWYIYSKKNC